MKCAYTCRHTHIHPKLIKSKIKTNKKWTNKTKIKYAQSEMRQNVYETTIDFILCCPTIPEPGVCPEVWLICPVRLHWRKPIASCLGLRVHVHSSLSPGTGGVFSKYTLRICFFFLSLKLFSPSVYLPSRPNVSL